MQFRSVPSRGAVLGVVAVVVLGALFVARPSDRTRTRGQTPESPQRSEADPSTRTVTGDGRAPRSREGERETAPNAGDGVAPTAVAMREIPPWKDSAAPRPLPPGHVPASAFHVAPPPVLALP